jgi:hypothetical protein
LSDTQFACPEVYAAVRDAVVAGLRIVRQHESRGDYVQSHHDFPKMGTFESGLPHFSKTSWGSDEAPSNYMSLFRDDHRPDKIPEWQPFYALADSNETLRRYFDERSMWMYKFRIGYAIESILDRYIHLTKKKEFDEAAFAPLYLEWENAVFGDNVAFDVLVPLLMVTCDFGELDVAEALRVEKMSEPFQLARSTEHRFPVSANECVVGAATHALVFQNWFIKNDKPCLVRSETLTSAEAFREVIERADHFFAALRAVAGVQTGYCQLLIRPDGWCDGGTAHLPQVEMIPLRSYPDHFEYYGWLRKPPTLAAAACAEAGKLYSALTTLKKNQLLVAARRLNLAMLRSSEQDSILDVAIGLETLLVEDGAKGEINHKLAMRLAALCKMRPFEGHQAADVFGLCKKLYEFRSAVAHGSRDMSKKRLIKVKDAKEPIEIIVLGTSLLRYVIRFLADKPEYLVPRNIDMTLFGSDASTEEAVE